jgi:hypothetical protein
MTASSLPKSLMSDPAILPSSDILQNSPSPTMVTPSELLQITASLYKFVPTIMVPSLFIPKGNVISEKVENS